MLAVYWLINEIFDIYWWIIFAAVASSWLIQFGIINAYNPNVRTILRVLRQLTDPVLDPIRRIIPPIAGLDISPIILLFALQFLKILVLNSVLPVIFQSAM